MDDTTDSKRRRNADSRVAAAYFAALRSMGVAPTTHAAPRGNVFHDVTIEGYRFQGVIVGALGPHILAIPPFRGHCALGGASISCSHHKDSGNGTNWYVCKHHTDPHINISMLSDAGRRALACEFGMPVDDGERGESDLRAEGFFQSPAFEGLKAWVQAHGRQTQSMQPNAHLGDWIARAKSARKAGVYPKSEIRFVLPASTLIH